MADTAGTRAGDTRQDPAEVAQMFDGVARRYDITQHGALVRGRTGAGAPSPARRSRLTPSDVVLDLAAGTAVIDGRAGQVGGAVYRRRLLPRHAQAGAGRPVPRSPPTP